MSRTTLLTSQLNALLRLTHTEMMIAQVRRAQAANPTIEQELAENAEKCQERLQLVADAIRRVGGVPDSLGAAVGRLGASLKSTLEQGQDLDGAILGDLALEHQLADRAEFVRMLAEELDEPAVVRVAERLQRAHRETIDWLMARLAEIAVGGPVGLRPTAVQTVAGFSRRVTQFPLRQAAGVVNRSVQTVQQVRNRAGDVVSSGAERTREAIDEAGDIARAGRDASLKRSEQIAAQRGETARASRIHSTRRGLGALDSAELPIRNYDSLNVQTATDRIARLADAGDVRAVLAYEQANKGRKGVVAAAEDRLELIAADLAAAS